MSGSGVGLEKMMWPTARADRLVLGLLVMGTT